MICKIIRVEKVGNCEKTVVVETDTSSSDCLQTFAEACFLVDLDFKGLREGRLETILRVVPQGEP